MDINYVTVSDVNKYVKIKLETDGKLQRLFVRAEISNFKAHTRGHLYFTLKDENSRVKAVMFAGSAAKLNFEPVDGMNVLIEGRLGVYEVNGDYQVYVEKMEQDGIGNLFLEYEKLKKRLAEEGLFDDKHKQLIPKYPGKVGVVTADTGAAIRDIVSTINRRYPVAEVILFPSLVQGSGAKESIAKQIEVAQGFDLDVLIVGRGGGSIEDLWAFNEEIVARAIFESKVPIISAVGHEVDFTIADFVADLRAPTPTGAAEMAVPNMSDLNNQLMQYKIRLNENLSNKIKHYATRLQSVSDSYILKNPMALYEVKEQRLDNFIERLNTVIKNRLDKTAHGYELLINKLTLLNPMAILAKGYSVVKSGAKVISDTKDLKAADKINVRFNKGEVEAIVERII